MSPSASAAAWRQPAKRRRGGVAQVGRVGVLALGSLLRSISAGSFFLWWLHLEPARSHVR